MKLGGDPRALPPVVAGGGALQLRYNNVMIRVKIAQMKATLWRLLRAIRSGEAVVISGQNVPVSELQALRTANRQKRKLGPERPGFEIPASFFEPLPDYLARAFAGEDP